MKKRSFLQSAALLAAVSTFSLAQAQTPTPIKFQLDWRFEGPAALFLQPVAKGHFKAAGLDVTVDAGNGSGGAVQRVIPLNRSKNRRRRGPRARAVAAARAQT